MIQKRENRTVDVYEQVRKGSSEYSGEKVRASKTCQDGNQRHYGHARDEHVVSTNAPTRVRGCSSHGSSRTSRRFTPRVPGIPC